MIPNGKPHLFMAYGQTLTWTKLGWYRHDGALDWTLVVRDGSGRREEREFLQAARRDYDHRWGEAYALAQWGRLYFLTRNPPSPKATAGRPVTRHGELVL